ncbi:hypothetical protein SAMN05216480_11546 [Pustulibacterium marinum]|uniref:Uncharacterized protein n=1 Tax=Pustulibacterium marinum TaxID=1224947 RepID=A0A1I7IE22_9FLAO|nr:hypothetical protein SAMN05216480_11546 [Pustulibacterium marinum]
MNVIKQSISVIQYIAIDKYFNHLTNSVDKVVNRLTDYFTR